MVRQEHERLENLKLHQEKPSVYYHPVDSRIIRHQLRITAEVEFVTIGESVVGVGIFRIGSLALLLPVTGPVVIVIFIAVAIRIGVFAIL